MSQKKKKQAALEAAYKKRVTKRDVEIMRALQAHVAAGHPFDKNMQTNFFSGAVWADDHVSRRNKWLYAGIGAVVASIVFMILTIFVIELA